MKEQNYNSNQKMIDQAIGLKEKIIKQSIGHPDLIKGCSESEILKLEQEYSVILPQSYKIFLEHFGHGLGGGIMKEIDILYNDIFSLTHVIRNEILIDEGDPILPDKAFVFTGRYNEQFMFFDASGLEKEPTIMYYMIDEDSFRKIGDSIFDIIEGEVADALGIKSYREQNRKNLNR